MSAALRLVDLAMSMAPTIAPQRLEASRPTFRPTIVPSLCPTLLPARRVSEAPSTQRSATVHPRLELAARIEAKNMLSVMRLNVDFLESLLGAELPAHARDAVREIHTTIDRLEQRFESPLPR